MHRYGSLEFTKNISFKTLIKIIQKAEEEEIRERLYKMYLVELPYMKRAMSFEQYYKKQKPKAKVKARMDTRSEEEIMNELIEIESKFKERG